MIELIALLTFASAAAAGYYALRPREDAPRRRIAAAGGRLDRSLEEGPLSRLVWPAAKRSGSAAAKLLPQNFVHQVEEELVMANNPMSLSTFLSLCATAAGTALALIVAIIRFSSVGGLQVVSVSIIFLFLGGYMPYFLLRRRAAMRRRAIQNALPDALDLLVTSIEAGLGVDAAFALVAERSSGPIVDLLQDYLRQVGLGRQRREALEDVARRSGVDDLIRLSATVAQATEIGTSMGDVLRLQARELRAARRLRAQERARRAPLLMSIPLALCFLPALVAVVIVPSVLNIIDFVNNLGGR